MARRVMTSVYLDPEDHAALRALSKVTRVRMADFIRAWIKQGMYGTDDSHWTPERIRDALARLAVHDSGEADELEADEHVQGAAHRSPRPEGGEA